MVEVARNVTIGLAQMSPLIGDVLANLDIHMEYIAAAKKSNVDLLLFPELSLTGYNLQDMVYEVGLQTRLDSPAIQALAQASADYQMDLMIGFVNTDERSRYYIAAAYLSGGNIIYIHNKVYPCTYALFDEGRFFAHGDSIRAFDTRFGRFGILICEDFWHASPAYLLWLDRADVILMQSASPGRGIDDSDRLGSAHWVRLVNQAYGSLFTNYIIHCNRVGYEDGLNFWGGSTVVGPDGEVIAEGPLHEDALVLCKIDLNQLRRTRTRLPLLRDERSGLVADEMARILNLSPANSEQNGSTSVSTFNTTITQRKG